MTNKSVGISTCSFCGRNTSDVRRLFQGMEGQICNVCVGFFTGMFAARNEEKPELRCSFCLAPSQELAVSSGARICRRCIGLCNEMTREQK